MLVDSSGKVISSMDKRLIGTAGLSEKEMSIVTSHDQGSKELNDENKYLISKKVRGADWYIVDKLSVSAITRSNRTLYRILGFSTVVIMMILFLCLIFITTIAISGAVEKDLRSIIKMIEQESVDSVITDPKDNKNSIIKLKSNVSRMLYKIRSLVAESYDAKVREREAELKALQSMINPHFLYNTLESINWMAYKYDAGEISSMVTLLAKYFRLSLNKGKDIVTLGDEFSLSSTYLDIQKTRFNDSFEYSIELDDRVSGFLIPKLIMQPVIENALLHGIQKNRGVKGLLSIRAYEEDGFVIIEIIDNGIGMTPEQIEGIMSCSSSEERKSYGIYNVIERVKLFFSEDSRISITSELQKGTTARYYLKQRG
jgi:two-component system sensor histidine kinase YesM